MEAETHINYVVEGRVPGKPWITFDISGNETEARKAHDSWCRSRRNQLEFRLVKRTAVVTDEVLESATRTTKGRATERRRVMPDFTNMTEELAADARAAQLARADASAIADDDIPPEEDW